MVTIFKDRIPALHFLASCLLILTLLQAAAAAAELFLRSGQKGTLLHLHHMAYVCGITLH